MFCFFGCQLAITKLKMEFQMHSLQLNSAKKVTISSNVCISQTNAIPSIKYNPWMRWIGAHKQETIIQFCSIYTWIEIFFPVFMFASQIKWHILILSCPRFNMLLFFIIIFLPFDVIFSLSNKRCDAKSDWLVNCWNS